MKIYNKHSGFSLIETMMSLLILSIILAAALPIVTVRTNATTSSGGDGYWKTINNTDIYYAEGVNQGVIIGANVLQENSKLEVHGTDNVPQLLVKGNSTQTNPILKITDSSDNSLLQVVDDGTVANTGLIVGPQKNGIGQIEGGEIKLLGANIDKTWNIDNYTGKLRFHREGVSHHVFGFLGDLFTVTNGSDVNVFKIADTGDVTIKDDTPNIQFNNSSGTELARLKVLGGLANLGLGINNFPNINTSASGNIAMVQSALSKLTTGDDNIAIGLNSLANNEVGDDNIALGSQALINIRSSGNVGIGERAIVGNAGSNNVAIGATAGLFVTGENNSIVGASALSNLSSGNNNIAIGNNAGLNTSGGSNNIFIGGGPASSSSFNSRLYIDNNSANDTPLIYGDFDNNELTINGNLNVVGTYSRNGTLLSSATVGSWSDARLKNITSNYNNGLEEISKLKTVEFKFKKDNKLKLDSEKKHAGVIAQDLQKVMPEAVEEGDEGYLQIDKDHIFYAMVNSIQELKKENDELKKDNDGLRAEIKEIKQYLDMPVKKENKKSWWQSFIDWLKGLFS